MSPVDEVILRDPDTRALGARQSAEPVLRVESLRVGMPARPGRAEVPVLDGVDLEVFAGQTVCVVGESGSGKSVTSLSIMGLLPRGVLKPFDGRVLLEGEDILLATPRRMRELRATRMAMVFQEPMTALNPVQTIGQQIEEVLCLHQPMPRTQRRDRVLQMLNAVHLPDVKRIHGSYPHQLSGGQRQRIVIAMALILEPRLLIADEPTTALDVTTQRQILSLIRELQDKQGTAVLFITHDFGVVSEIAQRIVVMHSGRIVETGTRDEVLARPAQAYTRMLVSSVPSLVPRPARQCGDQVVLEVGGLQKRYVERRFFGEDRVVTAASDVDFSIRRGEILGVVGESGSGKSTVARCVMRLIDPSAGSIRLQGDDIARVPRDRLRPLRPRIQMVFQDPYRSLNPRRSVGESVIEGLLNNGVSREEAMERARHLLETVGMPVDAMRRFPHQFSGGQRQRICIARAIALEPDVLVADEAVSALDVSVQAQVLVLLEDIRVRTGVAVLFITHDLRVAAQICDTIVVMKKGRIVEAGPASAVLTAPRDSYTRELIEAAPGRAWDFQHFKPLTP